ncbi:DUF2510 domain-containing protein [Arthrobacter sp. FW306-04-A]|uniref:DUF2510 domain-containing protein n=1 Tax=Arthrobacter sp. FW306-04-A TaxID=2879619 RepID=UPI0037C0F10C|nr:DUF2510 domain-containing protein [Arthrobacter sp. FW306-04-A]
MSTPAGWYRDPSNAPQTRYWDGNAWSDQVRPFDPPKAPPTAPQTPRKRRGKGWIIAGCIIAALGIVLGIVAASSTIVDGYGRTTQGGPTIGTFLVIGLGLALVAVGFCIRLLAPRRNAGLQVNSAPDV